MNAEKYGLRSRNGKKIHPITWHARKRQNAFAFAVPAFALLGEICRNHVKWAKKILRFDPKTAHPVLQSQDWELPHQVRKIHIRSASGHAQVTLSTGSKTFRDFWIPKSLNSSKSLKILNRVCELAMVVPAARRANSKCIQYKTLHVLESTIH